MGRDVVLVSSADETAFEVRAILDGARLRTGVRRDASAAAFVSSGDVDWFRELGRQPARPRARDR